MSLNQLLLTGSMNGVATPDTRTIPTQIIHVFVLNLMSPYHHVYIKAAVCSVANIKKQTAKNTDQEESEHHNISHRQLKSRQNM